MHWFYVVLLVILTGCAQNTVESTRPAPRPWQAVNGATDPARLKQSELICQNEAFNAANTGTSYIMQAGLLSSTMDSCMAKRGFIH